MEKEGDGYKYSYAEKRILLKYRGNPNVYKYLAQMIQQDISPQEINVLIKSLNEKHSYLVYNNGSQEAIQFCKSTIGGLKAYRTLQNEKQKRVKYETKLQEYERIEKVLQGQLECDSYHEFIEDDELKEDWEADRHNYEDSTIVNQKEFFKKDKKKQQEKKSKRVNFTY